MFGSNVRISPETELGKELAKHNKPYRYEPFPKMLYQARRRPDGIVRCVENDDSLFGGKPGAAEAWSTANTIEAQSEDQMLKLKGQGWVEGGPGKAIEAFNSRENKKADVAAHRAYEDRNMSEKAQEEIKAAESDTFEHVAEVPVKKVRKVRSDKGKPKVHAK